MKRFPRQAFFDRRSLILCALGAMLLYVLLIGGFITQQEIRKQQRQDALKAQIKKINSLSPAEKAIRKTQIYEAGMITAAQPFQRLLFDYLQRTYTLTPELSFTKTPLTIPQAGAPGYSEELDYLARIGFPERTHTTPPPHNPDGISYTNIYAANCDNIPLPSNFWTDMEKEYSTGGYNLTHDALALVFMKDNSCPIPDTQAQLVSNITYGMVKIADDPNTLADLRYEAVTLLELTGHRDLVKQQWIDQIVQEQLPDGSWAPKVASKLSNDHSTLLALWALLQYSRPQVQYQPLIRHPVNQ